MSTSAQTTTETAPVAGYERQGRTVVISGLRASSGALGGGHEGCSTRGRTLGQRYGARTGPGETPLRVTVVRVRRWLLRVMNLQLFTLVRESRETVRTAWPCLAVTFSKVAAW